jgi:intracellular septation protein
MTNQPQNKNHSTTKLLTEILPILLFFILYKYKGMIYATGGLIITTIIATFIKYKHEKKIFTVSTASCLLLTIFGGITIYTQDVRFIKMKVTLINLIFSITLFGGMLFKKGLAKYIYGEMIELSEKEWLKISLRWAVFFLVIAILNELIWRNLSEDFWIKFKVFGMIPLTVIFALLQMPAAFKKK